MPRCLVTVKQSSLSLFYTKNVLFSEIKQDINTGDELVIAGR